VQRLVRRVPVTRAWGVCLPPPCPPEPPLATPSCAGQPRLLPPFHCPAASSQAPTPCRALRCVAPGRRPRGWLRPSWRCCHRRRPGRRRIPGTRGNVAGPPPRPFAALASAAAAVVAATCFCAGGPNVCVSACPLPSVKCTPHASSRSLVMHMLCVAVAAGCTVGWGLRCMVPGALLPPRRGLR
jgi:hypothetical protein